MSEFDFDKEIDRRAVPALKHHSIVLGADRMDLFPAGVADMDFQVAPCITDAIAARAAHGVYGYETIPDLLDTLPRGPLHKEDGQMILNDNGDRVD